VKNVLIYINPKRKFDEESAALIKVQIDNSLALGWEADDILLLTNFDYEYNGIDALSLVIGEEAFCTYSPISTKVTAIHALFNQGLIERGILYWAHDLDAFQLAPIPESEIETALGTEDMGMCDYGRMPKWAGGSIFFKHGAGDIFGRIKEVMDEHQAVDEPAMYNLTTTDEGINRRIKKLNITYNFQSINLPSCYKMAIKPIRVAHFHPLKEQIKMGISKPLDFFKGENKINTQLIPDRLIELLSKHGVK